MELKFKNRFFISDITLNYATNVVVENKMSFVAVKSVVTGFK
jgi:hypothetical protein